MSDLIERLKGLLIPESPMHPIGCSAWEQEADYVVGAVIDHIEHLEKIIDCRDKSLTEEIALTAKFAALNDQKAQELSRLQSLSDQNRLTRGWRAVPIEATPAMFKAFMSCNAVYEIDERVENRLWSGDCGNFRSSYNAMLTALPLLGGEEKR